MPYTGGNIIGGLRNAQILRKGIAALLVFFVLLKGLIPVGYMPDMKALQDGVVKITICTAYGSQQIVVDEQGKAPDSKQQHHNAKSDFCPFGWMPHVALQVFTPFLLPSIFIAPQSLLAFQELFLSEPRHTLAEARAPPVTL